MRLADYDQAVEAGRRWYARYGRPASWSEWRRAEPGRPSTKTISRRWGWHAFWAAVTGIPAKELYPPSDQAQPASHRHLLDWSSEGMLEALHAARRAEGRWPRPRAWETATKDHPTRRAYVRRFGSWAAAIEAAGRLDEPIAIADAPLGQRQAVLPAHEGKPSGPGRPAASPPCRAGA